MSHRKTTLFVSGFGPQIRSGDLAYEFEEYGRLIRCDILSPKSIQSQPYAFVEFEDERDAKDAYYEMHGHKGVDGRVLNIHWAKNAPSRTWRYEGSKHRSPWWHEGRRNLLRRSLSPPRYRRRRSYSRSPSYTRSRSRGRSHSRRSRARTPERARTNVEDCVTEDRKSKFISPSKEDIKRRDSPSREEATDKSPATTAPSREKATDRSPTTNGRVAPSRSRSRSPGCRRSPP